MPTHLGAFAEAAARFDGVDPADWLAVRAFFTHTLPTLSVARRQAIIDFLRSSESAGTLYGVVVEFDPATWWGTIRSATRLYGFHGTQIQGLTAATIPDVGTRVRFVPTAVARDRILHVFLGTDP